MFIEPALPKDLLVQPRIVRAQLPNLEISYSIFYFKVVDINYKKKFNLIKFIFNILYNYIELL